MAWVNPQRAEILASQGNGSTLTTYDDHAERPTAPEPQGELVAQFPRPGRYGKPDEALRLHFQEYSGHRYLSLRIWTLDRETDMAWPTKRGCSIRVGEARELAAAILRAFDQVEDDDDDHPPAHTSSARNRGSAPPRREGVGEYVWGQQQLPPTPGKASEFDEF